MGILNCALALKTSLQPQKRTEFKLNTLISSQEGIHAIVTDYSTFMKLRSRIDFIMIHIYIDLQLGNQLEGAHI